MLSVIIFVGNGSISQVLVGFLAQCTYTFMAALYQPYENDLDDLMAHSCNVCLCLQLLAGVVFKASIGESDGECFPVALSQILAESLTRYGDLLLLILLTPQPPRPWLTALSLAGYSPQAFTGIVIFVSVLPLALLVGSIIELGTSGFAKHMKKGMYHGFKEFRASRAFRSSASRTSSRISRLDEIRPPVK